MTRIREEEEANNFRPQISTEFGKTTLRYMASTLWNGLRLDVRLHTQFENLTFHIDHDPRSLLDQC